MKRRGNSETFSKERERKTKEEEKGREKS